MIRRDLGVGLLLCLVLLTGCAPSRIAPLDASSVILAFGDSLTFGIGATVGGYPALLADRLACEVINAGVPGEVTAEGRLRLPALLEEFSPSLVILCHGGNDMLGGQDGVATKDNLEAMILACQAAGADVVLISVPRPSLLLRPPRFYRDLSKKHHLPLEADVLHEILSSPSLKSDRIHPNDAGYVVMTEAIAALIGDS